MRSWSIAAIALAICATSSSVRADSDERQILAALAIMPPPQQAPQQAPAPLPKPYDSVTVVLGGDLGVNASGQTVAADSVFRHGQRYDFAHLTRGLRGRLAGDIVFANLETVVTDRNNLATVDKAFNFRSHPNAIRHLLGAGFNVFSTANNHAIDYGEAGMAETIRHLAALRSDGLKAAPGTGFGRADAIAPSPVILPKARVHIAAVGIGGGTGGTSPARATMGSFHGADLHEAAAGLAATDGDIRMLSVHFGQELQVRPSTADERRLRDVVTTNGVDLLAGHHAHVAAGVQDVGGRILFYGLGNLLHPGMQDMASQGVCRDFGLLARIHFGRRSGDRFAVRAIEVWTLADMHIATRIRTGDEARLRLAVLNGHATGLDDADGSARGIRFAATDDGSGLYCSAHASDHDDALAARCRATESRAIAVSLPATPSCATTTVARSQDRQRQRGSPQATVQRASATSSDDWRHRAFAGR